MSAGGMGMLYEAFHPVLRSRVVIKTIRPELAHDEGVVERFRREAMSAARVRDDRLPQVFDHDVLPDGTPYMVMEYLEGEDLAARLAKGPLRPGVAVRIILEVLEVLGKVHRLGIVHRDIKPQNIFLARSDVFGELPKLLDFGVAHFTNDSATRPDEVLGTPMYMALEQADADRAVGPWTDVFAAGVVLYECIAGANERPWVERRALAYLTALRHGRPARPLTELAPHTPPGLNDVVMRAVSVEPEARFPDAAAFARALEPFARARGALYGSGEQAAMGSSSGPIQALTAGTGLPGVGLDHPRRPSHFTPSTQTAPTSPPETGAARRPSGKALLEQIRARLGAAQPEVERATRLVTGNHQHVTVLALAFQVAGAVSLDADTFAGVNDLIVEHLMAAIEPTGAHVQQPAEGQIVVLFGLERTHEDDAERALRLATAVQAVQVELDEALRPAGCGVRLRIAVHAGFVIRRPDGSVRLADQVPSVARRMTEAAPMNGLLLSRAVRDALPAGYTLRAAGELAGSGDVTQLFEWDGRREELLAETFTGGRPFVGREAELRAIERLLDEPEAPPVVAVLGPAGAGKSRLIEAIIERVGGRRDFLRARVERARSGGLAASVIMAALFEGDDGVQPRPDVLERQLRVLASYLPAGQRAELLGRGNLVRALVGLSPSVVREGVPGGRAQVFDLVALALEAAAGRARRRGGLRPVLCIDEAHRADTEGVALLRALPRLLAGADAPVLLLTARALEALELPAEIPVRAVPLSPLTAAEVDGLIDALAGTRRVSLAVRDLVHERAGGSPLFIEELMGRLAERGLLDAMPSQLADLKLPDSLYGLLLARVGRLAPRQREVVRHLSVLGAQFEGWLWDAVSDALHDAVHQTRPGRFSQATDELDELVQARILRVEREGDAPVYRFRQVLLRDAVYKTVLAQNRRLVHRLVADALAAREGDDPARYPALLFHYSRADALEETVRYGRLVGRRAAALGAFSDAVQAFRQAVDLQDQVPDSPAVERAGTLVDLAWVCLSTGDLEETLDRAADAVALLDALPDLEAVALRARGHTAAGQAAYLRNDWERAQTELELAEYLFSSAQMGLEAAYVQSMLGFVLRSMGQPEEGLILAQEAWRVIEPHGGPGILRVAHDLGNILRTLGRPADALPIFDRAASLTGEAEGGIVSLGPTDAWLAVAVRSARAIVHAELGDLDRAVSDQRWCFSRAERVGRRLAMMMTGLHLTEHLVQRAGPGDLAAARTLGLRVMELAVELRIFARAVKARLLLARVAELEGRPQAALEHLEAAEFVGRSKPGCEKPWLEAAKALARIYDGSGRGAEAEGLLALGRRIAQDRYDDSLAAAVEAWAQARSAG
ncbi:MAG: tetratricopeptide repeat protein [Myxococcales bacterium]|nr:tetratricopeptide repeat protein [Myxococcales bacterium]